MNKYQKALDNIRKVMHEQDADFRRESGLAPRESKPAPKIPSLKPEPAPHASHADSCGNLSPDRFLNTSIAPQPAPVQDSTPEFVEVIPQKDSRHSWLYNEVTKAVHNASNGNPNTKVVAVFVPVLQNGHEFEELPVHETVELPPVHEDDFSIDDDIDIQQDPQPAEAEHDETDSFALDESKPVRLLKDNLPEPEPEPQEPDIPEALSAEPEQAEHLGELLPDSIEHPDAELAEAFTTMEEKLDESIAAANEQPESGIGFSEYEDVSDGEILPDTEIPVADDVADDGEILPDTEIPVADEDNGSLPDLAFPDELEDDEIIDDIDESSEESKTL